MSNKLRTVISSRYSQGLKTFASAAIIASLTACGADTLDTIQSDLADGEDVNLVLSTNDNGDLVIGIADGDNNSGAGDDGSNPAPETSSLTVTLTNTSESQPMTPPVVVLHNAPNADNGMRLFQVGQPANASVVAIAENGNNAPLVEQLGYLLDQGRASAVGLGFADSDNPGPLLPGMSATVELDLSSPDQVMTIISMVVCTNDGFSAVDSHTLSSDQTETFMAPIYDAGSETNVLTLDYWVPPCGTEPNLTDNENGAIMPHPGQNGSENPAFDFEPGTRYLEVSITRN
jgi:hypothetical protein